MAIIKKTEKNWLLVDQDEDQFIGFTLPLYLDNGDRASTKTTMEAVKQNLRNLCSTEAGERIMQPNLGVRLKRFLFEPGDETTKDEIREVILESINYWLPFLLIKNMDIEMAEIESDSDPLRNTMTIKIDFSLDQNPTINDSIEVTI